MATPIRVISSMATRQLLADLDAPFARYSAQPVQVETVGGVVAARRVREGEAFDAVVLTSAAIDELIGAGRAVAGSRVDLVRSGVAVAVRSGAAQPAIGDEAAVKAAVLAARSLGYSTGPSGVYLAALFQRWGIADQIKDRIVQAPAGVPVGSLVAEGRVELGFQQLSELMGLAGITVLGPLPPAIQIMTTFSAGLCSASAQPAAVRQWFDVIASAEVAQIKRDNGMQPV